MMFFCILFSYTILRDTKDVLVRASTHSAPPLDRPCDAENNSADEQSTCDLHARTPHQHLAHPAHLYATSASVTHPSL